MAKLTWKCPRCEELQFSKPAEGRTQLCAACVMETKGIWRAGISKGSTQRERFCWDTLHRSDI